MQGGQEQVVASTGGRYIQVVAKAGLTVRYFLFMLDVGCMLNVDIYSKFSSIFSAVHNVIDVIIYFIISCKKK
jgi:hypothetical protein